MTVPNRVTLGGMVAVALYAVGYLFSHIPLLLVSFGVAVASDILDGFLARRLHQKSRLGAILDPVRDRMLLLAFLGNLFAWGFVASVELFLVVIIVGCEGSIWVTRILYMRATHGGYVRTNRMGRCRQVVHVTLMGVFLGGTYLFGSPPHPAFVHLLGMALVSLSAFAVYLVDARGAWKKFQLQHMVPR